MGRTKCALCKNYEDKENKRSFFKVPKLEYLRKRWVDKCGKNFSCHARVCEDHFSASDFINPPGVIGTKVRLQPGAIPKLLPPYDDHSSLLPSAAVKHVELINEELFDEIVLDPLVVSEEDGEEGLTQATDEMEYVCQNSSNTSMPYISKGVQTGSSKTRTCGFIEVSVEKPIYNMICFHCGIDFPIWSWAKFVTHVKENHNNLEKAFTNTDDLYNEETTIKTQYEIVKSDNKHDKSKTEELSLLEGIPTCEESLQKEIVEINREDSGGSNEFDIPTVEESLEDEIMEITTQDFKGSNESLSETRPESTTYVSCNNPISYSHDVYKPLPEETQEIRFATTNPKITMDFLDLLKTFPILCAKKSTPAYNNALSEFTDKFNAKCSLAATIPEMRRSINRTKEWYRRTYIGIRDNPDFKHKYIEYFDKCAEFLNYEELHEPDITVRCDICKHRLRSEKNLQAHKFMRHNIGELPYKCSHCENRFATTDRLESHERTHTRSRSFICEICEKGFYNQFQLTGHMKIHDEDNKKMCHICGKKFRTLSRLRTHKVLHEARKFKCNICSQAYHRNCYLVEHMKAHRNQRDHICDKCGKAFVRRKNLMEHKQSVHVEDKAAITKRYPCQICGKEFRYYTYLYHHRKVKHLVLEGTVEELSIDKTAGRTKHKYIIDPVTNTKRVVCDVCGNTYSFISGLIAHKMKMHGYVRLKDKPVHREMDEDGVGEVVPTEVDCEEVEVEDDQYEDEHSEWSMLFDDIIYTDSN